MTIKSIKKSTQFDTEWKTEDRAYYKMSDEIIDYLLSKKDITYDDMKTVLEETIKAIQYLGVHRI